MIKVNELYEIQPCKNDHVWDIFWIKEISLAEDVKATSYNPIHNLDYNQQKKHNLNEFEDFNNIDNIAIAICRKCGRIKLYNYQINMYTFAEQHMANGGEDENDVQKLFNSGKISKEEYENLLSAIHSEWE